MRQKNGVDIYMTHKESMDYNIPSVDQWKELMSCCRWKFKTGRTWSVFYCIGPNGNLISFHSTGLITTQKSHSIDLFFWLYDMDNPKLDKHVAYANINKEVRPFVVATRLVEIFEGYKLPIRLVQTIIKE